MIQLDLRDRRPIYEQIKERFKELIITGAVKEQEKIPSVRELASILAINPNTIQRAYKELEEEGYIYSLRSKGSFVAPVEKAEKDDLKKTLYETMLGAARRLLEEGEDSKNITEQIKNLCSFLGKETSDD